MGYIHYFYGLVFFLFFPLKGECTKLNLTFLPNILSQWSSNLVIVRIPGIGLPDLAIKNIEHAVNFQLNTEEFCYMSQVAHGTCLYQKKFTHCSSKLQS